MRMMSSGERRAVYLGIWRPQGEVMRTSCFGRQGRKLKGRKWLAVPTFEGGGGHWGEAAGFVTWQRAVGATWTPEPACRVLIDASGEGGRAKRTEDSLEMLSIRSGEKVGVGGHQAKEPHNSLSFFITWRHFPIFNESLKSFSSYCCPTADD